MVRARVVDDPMGWKWSGCHERLAGKGSYRLLSDDLLRRKLSIGSDADFLEWYDRTLRGKVRQVLAGGSEREAFWSESSCVGDEAFAVAMSGKRGRRGIKEVEPGVYSF